MVNTGCGPAQTRSHSSVSLFPLGKSLLVEGAFFTVSFFALGSFWATLEERISQRTLLVCRTLVFCRKENPFHGTMAVSEAELTTKLP